MKKIGVLFGQERSFPKALVEKINSMNPDGVVAEEALIEEVIQNQNCGYAVLIDRISQDVPFYRAMLKNAAATGTAVINNPLWWSSDDKFLNNVLAEKVGVPVPKTILLPSKEMPTDTTSASFSNLKYPLDVPKMIDHLGGFPLYMKPYAGGGWKSVYKVNNEQEMWKAYDETGQLVMMLQEAIDFDSYWRCYCIGRKYVHIMPYEPRNPHHLRYQAHFDVPQELLDTIHDYVLRLNEVLGYEFNTVEFAVRNGVPIAIDFGNPAPDAEVTSVGQENFDWVIEHAAKYAIERAQAHQDGKYNIGWGTMLIDTVKDFEESQKPKAKKAKRKSVKR